MEMCYNDCKLNRTESKPKARCQICQILVHNIYLDEPKKTISSGAWTCRDCRKNPFNTKILLNLVTGLCDKIAILEPIIPSPQKQTILTSSSTQTDSLSDRAHMCTQTEDESPPIDVFEDITASSPNDTGIINPPHEQDVSMVIENTSATVSYLHAMLDGIEQNKDNDNPLSNPICSATIPVVKTEPDRKIFNHVFIGNLLSDTTVEEVRLFLLKRELLDTERVYVNSILQNGLESGNNKPFWKYVKSQTQETFGISALKSNGNVITDSLSKADILNSQFKSVFTHQSGNTFPPLPSTQFPKSKPLYIYENCVFMLLDRIDVSKSSGPDKLPRRLLRSLAKEITPVVYFIFTQSLCTGKLPTEWTYF